MVSQFCNTALILSVFLPLSLLTAESSTTLTGPNVCSTRVSLIVSRSSTSQQREAVKSKTRCYPHWGWFAWNCATTRFKYYTVYTTTYSTSYSTRSFCCPGYSAAGENCRPVCSPTCKNGGTCARPGQCHCASGWTGSNCTIPVCSPTCKNGGTCARPGQCQCAFGWTGSNCTIPVCSPTCKNSGTCVRPEQCQCASGWTGSNCAIPVCSPTCKNGGTCERPGQCQCASGWTGSSCTMTGNADNQTASGSGNDGRIWGGVGVGIFVLLVALVIFIVIYRRRRKRKDSVAIPTMVQFENDSGQVRLPPEQNPVAASSRGVDYDGVDELLKPNGKEQLADRNMYAQPVVHVVTRRNFDNPIYNSLNPQAGVGMASGTFAPELNENLGYDKTKLPKGRYFDNPNYGLSPLSGTVASPVCGRGEQDVAVYECPRDVSED